MTFFQPSRRININTFCMNYDYKHKFVCVFVFL